MRQERRTGLAGVSDEMDQPVSSERGVGREPGKLPQSLRRRGEEQVRGKVDCRSSPRYVVLEVGIQPLVTQIKLRSQDDHQHPQVEARKTKGLFQSLDPR